jgi:chloride channel protein, CIC family
MNIATPDQSAQSPTLASQMQRRSLILIAATTGALAGGFSVLYQLGVVSVESAAKGLAHFCQESGGLWLLLVPLVSAALAIAASLVTKKIAPESSGSGIPHIKAALMGMQPIRAVRIICVKASAGLIALASGMSLGREGPTIQVGGAIGKLVCGILKVPPRYHGTFIACGAGAGLAAAFNAPLAGFLFVMEELRRGMSSMTYGTALAGSVCAVAVIRITLGQEASFIIGDPGPLELSLLPAVIIAGAAAGLLGVAFNKALLFGLKRRDRLPKPKWVYSGFVGACAGLALIVFPEITGSGHAVAELLLLDRLPGAKVVQLALILLIGKFLLTVLSYSTRVPGGIFTPILAIGASAGWLFAHSWNFLLPSLGVPVPVFATIGMAGMLTGSVRAPLTAVVLIFEMTGEYSLLYALFLGALFAYLVAEWTKDVPVYEALMEYDLDRKRTSTGGSRTDFIVVDLTIETHSSMDGKRVKELELPGSGLISGLNRSGRFMIPRGGTLLQAGDIITVVIEGSDAAACSIAFHGLVKGI